MNKRENDVKLLLESLLVGAATGLVIGLFRFGIMQTSSFWLHLFSLAHKNKIWLLVIILGFILVGVFAGYLVKQNSHVGGSGIPEVKLQLAGKLHLAWWPILWRKLIGGVLVIGTGLFLGPEGPSLQLGSSVGQGIGETCKESNSNVRVLLATGAASGLSAAFGAPLSGALFVLEEVFHNFSSRVGLNALAGSLVSALVVSNLFGLKPALALPYKHTFPVLLYWQLVILGLILGLLGHIYKLGLFECKALYGKITLLPRWLYGLIPLALLIPIAYFWPLITGPGNRLILALPRILTNNSWQLVGTLIGFYVLRIIFSIVSYGSGLPSGIFLPILTMGALIGAGYGMIMVQLHLLPQRLMINLVIFAMAGYFAAIIRAPFTAIVLITEMVGSLLHLMPLALVAFVALLVDKLLGGKPIYDSLAQAMAKQMDSKEPVTESGLSDQLTVAVYEDSSLVGQTIAQVAWPKATLVRVIHRGSRDIIPDGKTRLIAGDLLVLEVDASRRGQVYSQMKQLQGI